MARLIADGEIRVHWVVTIANPAAPTVAEITAGTDITPLLSSIDTPNEGEAVPANDLSSAFNKTVPGRFGGSPSLDAYRDDTADTAYALFPRNTIGYLVVRRFGGSNTAFAAAQKVDVWNVRVITRSANTLDSGSIQMFTVNFAALDEPDEDVAVAA